MIKGIIIGFFLAVAILAGGCFHYFAAGLAPVAVADPPMPFEKILANMAVDAHLEKQPVLQSPVSADEPSFLAGAEVYKRHCAACHGLPGQPPTDYAATMYPKPTQLFRGKGVTDVSAFESYWKVVNGIRMSGMPAFKTKLSDVQLWNVSQLVAHANEIPESVNRLLIPNPDASFGTCPDFAIGSRIVTK